MKKMLFFLLSLFYLSFPTFSTQCNMLPIINRLLKTRITDFIAIGSACLSAKIAITHHKIKASILELEKKQKINLEELITIKQILKKRKPKKYSYEEHPGEYSGSGMM